MPMCPDEACVALSLTPTRRVGAMMLVAWLPSTWDPGTKVKSGEKLLLPAKPDNPAGPEGEHLLPVVTNLYPARVPGAW